MPSFSLRLLAHQTLLGLAALTTALVTPSPYDGLVPRDVTLPDGTTAIVYENPLLTFHKTREADVTTTPSTLSKRLQYISYGTPSAGRNDYCGEWNPSATGGPNAPTASDCAAISAAYTIQTKFGPDAALGYWTVSVADWNSGWITLAAVGTCKFAIKLNPSQTAVNGRFGAGDLRFYVNGAVGQAVGGKSEASGSVSCWTGVEGSFLSTSFKVTKV